MAMINKPKAAESTDKARLELYRLIGEGYKDVQEGRVSTINEVRENIDRIRSERG